MNTTKKIKSVNKNKYNNIINCINTLQDELFKNVKYNNGVKLENIFCYNMDNITMDINTTIQKDNKDYFNFGDYKKGNLIYQVKSMNSELHLLKILIQKYNININNKEQLIDLYIKYNKANRYSYIITYNDKTYAIIMNKKQFKNFAMQFGRYSESKHNIRFFVADSTIYKWLGI